MKTIPLLTEKNVRDIQRSLVKLALVKFQKTGRPLVTLKYAQTLDGKIATVTGDSRWISGPASLRLGHIMRSCHDAILVGVNTIIQDDPLLTVRLVKGRNPQKIILDSRLRMPLDSRILKKRSAPSSIIATTSLASKRKIDRLQSAGAQVWVIRRNHSGQVDLEHLLRALGQADIRSILVEGGSKVISSFLSKQLADHLLVIVAPKIIGKGIPSVNATTTSLQRKPLSPTLLRYFASGDDVILQTFLRS